MITVSTGDAKQSSTMTVNLAMIDRDRAIFFHITEEKLFFSHSEKYAGFT